MSKEEMNKFLAGRHLARIATIQEDGAPYCVPVWYDWDGKYLYSVGSKKYIMLQAIASLKVDSKAIKFYVKNDFQSLLLNVNRILRRHRLVITHGTIKPNVQSLSPSQSNKADRVLNGHLNLNLDGDRFNSQTLGSWSSEINRLSNYYEGH